MKTNFVVFLNISKYWYFKKDYTGSVFSKTYFFGALVLANVLNKIKFEVTYVLENLYFYTPFSELHNSH